MIQKAFIREEEIKAIQAKENLTLIEAALLLNISPLTLRRWILDKKMNAYKIGKKWQFRAANLNYYMYYNSNKNDKGDLLIKP